MLGLVFLTAHGWGVVDYLLAFSRSSDALNLISEWAPPNLVSIARAPFLVAIVLSDARGGSRQGNGAPDLVCCADSGVRTLFEQIGLCRRFSCSSQ